MSSSDELEKFEWNLADSYFNKYGLPDHVVGGIRRYIVYGIKPGSFLTALFEGDLFAVYALADHVNLPRIGDFVGWIYNHAPILCWGSPTKAAAWIARGGMMSKGDS